MNHTDTKFFETIIALCKRRGFAYPASTIYGGLANTYDYGPLGAQLLKNIKDLWWKSFIENRSDMVGLDSQIIQHPETWVASGHVSSFNDPLVEDTVTHKRYRADHLIESWIEKHEPNSTLVVDDLTIEEMNQFIEHNAILSPDGNAVSAAKAFNLLFETSVGSTDESKSRVYLRGETAQGIFLNFKNILDSSRVKLPFGVGQVGKSFRNEVTTGQFVFRTLEFEQAEIEYFFDPNQTEWKTLFKDWQDAMWQFVTHTLGVSADNLRWRQHSDAERSFYSKETYDLDYKFPFGFKELWGIAYRTDYDLKQHSQHSGKDLSYVHPQTGERFVPHVIEPALGVNRVFLMVLADAYHEDTEKNRVVLKLQPNLAPYQVAVFPLLKNKPELVEKARAVFASLNAHLRTTWDDRGNIGKRYLYQDEIGTPACVTIDFETLDDDSVTVRDRDTAEQQRIALANLHQYLERTYFLS